MFAKIGKILVSSVLAVVGVVAMALLVLSFLDWNVFRDEIASLSEKFTGRRLVIEGDLDVTLIGLPAIQVGAKSVHFENASWASGEMMFEARSISFKVALMPLLVGHLSIEEANISNGFLHLSRNAEGKPNWSFADAQDSAAPKVSPEKNGLPFTLTVLHAAIDNFEVSWLGAPGERVVRSKVERLTGKFVGDTGRLKVGGTGQVEGLPFTADVDIGSVAALLAGEIPKILTAKLALAGNSMSLDAVSQDETTEAQQQPVGRGIRFLISGDRLAVLLQAVGIDTPGNVPEVMVSGLLALQGDTISVRDFLARVGESEIVGYLGYGRDKQQEPSFNVDLTANLIRPQDFLAFVPENGDTSENVGKTLSKNKIKESEPSKVPGLPDFFTNMSGDLDVVVKRVGGSAMGQYLDGGEFHGHLDDGRIDVKGRVALAVKSAEPLVFAGSVAAPELSGGSWVLRRLDVRFGGSRLAGNAALSEVKGDAVLMLNLSTLNIRLQDIAPLAPELVTWVRQKVKDQDASLQLSLSQLKARYELNSGAAELDAAGQVVGLPFTVDAEAVSLAALMDEGPDRVGSPFALTASVAGNRIALSGRESKAGLHAEVTGDHLGNILGKFGYELAQPVSPVKASADIFLQHGRLVVETLRASIGESRLQGRMSYNYGGSESELDVDLRVPLLRYDDIAALAPSKPNEAPYSLPSPSSPDDEIQIPVRVPAILEDLNADMLLSVEEYRGPAIGPGISGANVKAQLRGGSLNIETANIKLADAQDDISISGTVDLFSKQESVIQLKKFQVRHGASIVKGKARIDLARVTPAISVDLVAPLLRSKDLAAIVPELGAALGVNETPTAKVLTEGKADEDSSESDWLFASRESLPLATLRTVNISLNLEVEKYEGRIYGQKLENLAISARSLNGDIEVDSLFAGLANQGAIALKASALTEGQELKVDASVGFRGLQIGRAVGGRGKDLGPLTPSRLLEARLKGYIDLRARGSTWHEIALHTGGTIGASVEQGNINAAVIEAVGFDVTETLAALAGYTPSTQLNCFLAVVEIRNGLIKANNVVLATEDSNIAVDGHMSLPEGTIDLAIHTYPTDFSLGSIRAPLLITGKIPDVSIRPKMSVLIGKAAASLALGIVLHPALAVLPLIEIAPGEEKICQTYEPQLASIEQRADSIVESTRALAH